jgi:hypothetical protein
MKAPPADLVDEARVKWCEIVGDQADELDPLTLDTIRVYCVSHAEEQAALRLLAGCPNPFIIDQDGKLTVNPLRAVIRQARAEMARLRRELRGQRIQVGPHEMTAKKARVLLEIQRRHLELANITTPTKADLDALEHGPLFSPVQWFDSGDNDAERMRWQRAMKSLIDDGFVVATKTDGCKRPNVKLSEAGEEAIESLTEAEAGAERGE